MKPLLIALQFLTRFPVRVAAPIEPRDHGLSVAAYPWVGLLIGLLLVIVYAFLAGADTGLVAVLLLVVWVGVTGALHLDGLADTADAWIGGQGSRQRTLEIMKDPASGPLGVVALVLLLLVKFAALNALLQRDAWVVLLVAPMLGRGALTVLLLTTPYVRPGGLGSELAAGLAREACWWSLGVAGVTTLFLLGWNGTVVAMVGAAVLWLLRRACLMRLGGITGDTLGALCEISEASVLVTLALLTSA